MWGVGVGLAAARIPELLGSRVRKWDDVLIVAAVIVGVISKARDMRSAGERGDPYFGFIFVLLGLLLVPGAWYPGFFQVLTAEFLAAVIDGVLAQGLLAGLEYFLEFPVQFSRELFRIKLCTLWCRRRVLDRKRVRLALIGRAGTSALS
jgi:hypothetical protein